MLSRVQTCIQSLDYLLFPSLIILVFLGCSKNNSDLKKPQLTIAISQITEHPSLDQEREGILEALRDAGYTDGLNLNVIYQNAQGSPVTSTQIAQKFVSLSPDVIVAISTPSAQSALAAIGKKRIPLVFTAVTDPVSARLVKSLDHPGQGVSGVSDYLPADSQLQFVRKLIPNIQSLGVIYNPGEANSVVLFRELQDRADSFRLKLIAATAHRTSEVGSAAQSLVGRVAAIYIPNDNTAVSAIESAIYIGIDRKIPVLAGDAGSVQKGAAAAVGYHRKKLGKAAGAKVIQFLKNGYGQEIPVEIQNTTETILNRSSAEKMGLHLNEKVKL